MGQRRHKCFGGCWENCHKVINVIEEPLSIYVGRLDNKCHVINVKRVSTGMFILIWSTGNKWKFCANEICTLACEQRAKPPSSALIQRFFFILSICQKEGLDAWEQQANPLNIQPCRHTETHTEAINPPPAHQLCFCNLPSEPLEYPEEMTFQLKRI